MPIVPRVILVTGSSSGFGRSLVDAILASGDIAVATLRKPAVLDDLKREFGPDRLLVLPLDTTKKSDIVDAFARVKEVYGRLDAVISNAGYSALVEAEGSTEDFTRHMFEVNVFACMELAKAAVQFFRDVNPTPGGRFIQLSSGSGVTVTPSTAIYCATKHGELTAMEAYTETLGQEMAPEWKIKTTLICPSVFKTSVFNAAPDIPLHPAYVNRPDLSSNVVRAIFAPDGPNPAGSLGDDPAKAARAILSVIGMDDPPVRMPLGEGAFNGFKAKAKALNEQADRWESVAKSMGFHKEA